MSKWIDADALIAELQKDEAKFDKEAEDAKDDPSYTEGYSDAMWSRANGIRDAMIEIYDAPSIDIVRCKECKWGEVVRNHSIGFCENQCGVRSAITESSYCSYGERREP